MPSPTPPVFHGGGLNTAAETYGIPNGEWLDLSTGINPAAYPLTPLDAPIWRRLPDRDAERRLCAAAAGRYGAPGPDSVVPVPGTQAAIQWLPRLVDRTTVAVISPTYGEHAPCWRMAGHRVVEVPDLDAVPDDATVAVLVNPNNPTGRIHPPEEIVRHRDRFEALVIDEAFMDMTPELSMAPHAGAGNILILRSFGKFYGLAGLRLGFVIASGEWAARLASALGPWAVSGPALELGSRALEDETWSCETREALAAKARRLDETLSRSGLADAGGTHLFRLAEHPHAGDVFKALCRSGILARPFETHPTWLRFGLPGDETDWTRLEGALERTVRVIPAVINIDLFHGSR